MQIHLDKYYDQWVPTAETFASLLTELTAARQRWPTNLKTLQILAHAIDDVRKEVEPLKKAKETPLDEWQRKQKSMAFYMSLVVLVSASIRVMEEGDPDLPAYTPPTAEDLDEHT